VGCGRATSGTSGCLCLAAGTFLASHAIASRIRVDGPVPASNRGYAQRAKQTTGVFSMATLATGRPVLNIGKISDSRFKFSFATEEGTLFCEISVPMKAGGAVSDDLRQREGGRCQT
jgi:hypothetical protein